jgi:hypothetical protein
MVLALAFLATQHADLTKQPTAVELVEYRRVQNALPTGAPDPRAADNFFVRITSRYSLLADSDAINPDPDGTRQFNIPAAKIEYREWYSENKRAPKALEAAFTQVARPWNRSDFHKHKTAWGSSAAFNQPTCKGNHSVVYVCHATTEEVEVHTLGKKQFTRIHARESSSTTGNTMSEGQYWDPATNRNLCDGKFDVRVDPPTYTY